MYTYTEVKTICCIIQTDQTVKKTFDLELAAFDQQFQLMIEYD
jgi:hypothetical protein